MNPAIELLRQPKNRPRAIRLLEALLVEEEREQARKDAIEAERQLAEDRAQAIDHEAENARCAADIVYWFNTWVWTYDPRVITQRDETGKARSPYMQFKLWPKQEEFVRWMLDRIREQEPWGIKKSRDQGATYLIAGVALYMWLFEPGFKTTLTSGRGADFIDKIGNQDSVFEKLRIMYRRLPEWMLPAGFLRTRHDSVMRLINPATGSLISGEPGEEAGRSGRSSLYLVDEAQILTNPTSVEASIVGNADCVGWVGTFHPTEGQGNFYARKIRSLPNSQVFTLHWRDDPRKDEAWAIKKKSSLTDPTTWEAEYEMNPDARSDGMCIPSLWVRSAIDLAKLEPRLSRSARGITGGDIGGGKAKSVAVTRFGPVVPMDGIADRLEADTTDTAYWLLSNTIAQGASTLNFDAPGIGAGVSSTLTKAGETDDNGELVAKAELLKRDIPLDGVRSLKVVGVNTGVAPSEMEWPDDRKSDEMFGNLKAELWWLGRTRFQRTHEHVLWLRGQPGGAEHSIWDLISIPDHPELVPELSVVKWTKNEKGKIVIESKIALAKRGIPSPDYADAFMLSLLEPGEDDMGLGDLSGMGGGDFARANPWAL